MDSKIKYHYYSDNLSFYVLLLFLVSLCSVLINCILMDKTDFLLADTGFLEEKAKCL
ncbi:MAG: hypothetical protein ACI95X_001669 [Paraglaciecola sp.]|jgi:hypothetical protein